MMGFDFRFTRGRELKECVNAFKLPEDDAERREAPDGRFASGSAVLAAAEEGNNAFRLPVDCDERMDAVVADVVVMVDDSVVTFILGSGAIILLKLL